MEKPSKTMPCAMNSWFSPFVKKLRNRFQNGSQNEFLYAPRQPPTLVRSLRLNTLRVFFRSKHLRSSQTGTGPRGGQRAKAKGLGHWEGVPSGPFGAQGPFGAFGVIPELFRVDGHYEWMAFTSGCLLREDALNR